jgi:hypothetical protein
MRALIIATLLLFPVSASALDCNPFLSWTCAQQGYFDVLAGQPGEVLCGVDYTGWTFSTVEVTVTQPGFYAFQGISAAASQVIVDTAIILMDDCGAATCVSSEQSDGVTGLLVCLDVGTHTFVVASNTTASTAFMNIGFQCLTCAEALANEFDCPLCNTVKTETNTWGFMKMLFR